MKIGITCYPTYGGSGALATELGIALAGRGHEVHFITYTGVPRVEGCWASVRQRRIPSTRSSTTSRSTAAGGR